MLGYLMADAYAVYDRVTTKRRPRIVEGGAVGAARSA